MSVAEHVDPRSLLANERTLLAWIRTGLALMAFGFVIDRLALWFRFELHRDERMSLAMGTTAIGLGAACQLIGAIRFVATRRALLAGASVTLSVAGPIAVVVLVALFAAALVGFLLSA